MSIDKDDLQKWVMVGVGIGVFGSGVICAAVEKANYGEIDIGVVLDSVVNLVTSAVLGYGLAVAGKQIGEFVGKGIDYLINGKKSLQTPDKNAGNWFLPTYSYQNSHDKRYLFREKSSPVGSMMGVAAGAIISATCVPVFMAEARHLFVPDNHENIKEIQKALEQKPKTDAYLLPEHFKPLNLKQPRPV